MTIRDYTQTEVEQILSRYGNGEPYSVIARSMNMRPEAAKRILEENGCEVSNRREGKNHGRWKGGQPYVRNNYKFVYLGKKHPFVSMTGKRSYIGEHRLVMAEHLGRPLLSSEHVHHINGIRDDNRIENLQLVQQHHPTGFVLVCRCCGSHDIEYQEMPSEDGKVS